MIDYQVGQRVRHERFGEGVVSSVNGETVHAAFPGFGSRKIFKTFLDDQKRSAGRSAPKARSPLKIICATEWHGRPVPPQHFHVPGLVPARTVILLGGDGSTGKSLLAQQLVASTALHHSWIGIDDIDHGCSIYFSAEDDIDELQRRFAKITEAYGRSLADCDDLHIIPLAGEDAVLAGPNGRSGIIEATELWRQLEQAVENLRPRLIVLDTLADLFSGDENHRSQARQFIGLLRSLAINYDTTIIVLAHPSLSGMSSGSGSSGSTGWSNSVRSRLYLERVFTDGGEKGRAIERDEDIRELSIKKANYGSKGAPIRLRWVDGVFERQASAFGLDSLERDATAELAFMSLLRLTEGQGISVSPKPSTSYAPAVFARRTDANGVTKRAFQGAMERLLKAGTIRVVDVGPAYRRTTKLTAYNDADAQ